MKATKGRTAEELWNALERAELRLDQEQRKNKVLTDQVSRLTSTLIAIRNLTLPPGKKVLSEDLELEKRNGQED